MWSSVAVRGAMCLLLQRIRGASSSTGRSISSISTSSIQDVPQLLRVLQVLWQRQQLGPQRPVLLCEAPLLKQLQEPVLLQHGKQAIAPDSLCRIVFCCCCCCILQLCHCSCTLPSVLVLHGRRRSCQGLQAQSHLRDGIPGCIFDRLGV